MSLELSIDNHFQTITTTLEANSTGSLSADEIKILSTAFRALSSNPNLEPDHHAHLFSLSSKINSLTAKDTKTWKSWCKSFFTTNASTLNSQCQGILKKANIPPSYQEEIERTLGHNPIERLNLSKQLFSLKKGDMKPSQVYLLLLSIKYQTPTTSTSEISMPNTYLAANNLITDKMATFKIKKIFNAINLIPEEDRIKTAEKTKILSKYSRSVNEIISILNVIQMIPNDKRENFCSIIETKINPYTESEKICKALGWLVMVPENLINTLISAKNLEEISRICLNWQTKELPENTIHLRSFIINYTGIENLIYFQYCIKDLLDRNEISRTSDNKIIINKFTNYLEFAMKGLLEHDNNFELKTFCEFVENFQYQTHQTNSPKLEKLIKEAKKKILYTQASISPMPSQEEILAQRKELPSIKINPKNIATKSGKLLVVINKHLVKANGIFPRIKYLDKKEKGYDLGGVSRDFVTKIFTNLCKKEQKELPLKEVEEGTSSLFIPQIKDDPIPQGELSKADKIRCYESIGCIFATPIIGQDLLIGHHFHPIVFKMLHCLTLKDLYKIPVQLESFNEIPIEIRRKLFEVYIKNMYPSIKLSTEEINNLFLEKDCILPDKIKSYDEDLKTTQDFFKWIEFDSIALPIAIIASSIEKNPFIRNQWDDIKATKIKTPQILQDIIEGALSKETVLNALNWNGNFNTNTKEFLNQWINEASSEDLKKIVFAITGLSTLKANTKLTISCHNDNSRPFAFRTCFFSMELFNGFKDFLSFKEALDKTLMVIPTGPSFTIA